MKEFLKFNLLTYTSLTMGYGAVRKIVYIHDAKVHSYSNEGDKKLVPMLNVTKAGIVTIGAFSSIYLWPIYLGADLSRIEIKMRGLDKNDYNIFSEKYRSITFLDYLYM